MYRTRKVWTWTRRIFKKIKKEALERFRIRDEREKRKAHGDSGGINSDESHQVINEQNTGFEGNRDVIYRTQVVDKLRRLGEKGMDCKVWKS